VASILINRGILPKTYFWVKNELFKLIFLIQKPQSKKIFLPFDLPDDFPIEIQVNDKKIPRWIISSIPLLRVAIIKFITKNDSYDDDKRLIDSILNELNELRNTN
jgi:hypothetical protein